MDNILSKMYAKNSDFQEIVDKYLITGGGNQRTGTAASTAHPAGAVLVILLGGDVRVATATLRLHHPQWRK